MQYIAAKTKAWHKKNARFDACKQN